MAMALCYQIRMDAFTRLNLLAAAETRFGSSMLPVLAGAMIALVACSLILGPYMLLAAFGILLGLSARSLALRGVDHLLKAVREADLIARVERMISMVLLSLALAPQREEYRPHELPPSRIQLPHLALSTRLLPVPRTTCV